MAQVPQVGLVYGQDASAIQNQYRDPQLYGAQEMLTLPSGDTSIAIDRLQMPVKMGTETVATSAPPVAVIYKEPPQLPVIPSQGTSNADEVQKLKDEVKRLQALVDQKSMDPAEKSHSGIISGFHSPADGDEPQDPFWDIFSLSRRFSLSTSPLATEIRDKYKPYGGLGGALAFFDHFFSITQRKTEFFKEFYGGVTTFFSMAYILALNPIIVAGAIGMKYKAGLFFSTCLASGVFTFLMGILANLPVALAPGMGLNGYFANVARVTETGILVGILTWQQGMAAVFMSGLLYLFLTISGLRFLLFKVPRERSRRLAPFRPRAQEDDVGLVSASASASAYAYASAFLRFVLFQTGRAAIAVERRDHRAPMNDGRFGRGKPNGVIFAFGFHQWQHCRSSRVFATGGRQSRDAPSLWPIRFEVEAFRFDADSTSANSTGALNRRRNEALRARSQRARFCCSVLFCCYNIYIYIYNI
jgi:hypothetical protein